MRPKGLRINRLSMMLRTSHFLRSILLGASYPHISETKGENVKSQMEHNKRTYESNYSNLNHHLRPCFLTREGKTFVERAEKDPRSELPRPLVPKLPLACYTNSKLPHNRLQGNACRWTCFSSISPFKIAKRGGRAEIF